MPNPGRSTPRAKRRAILLASAVMAGLLSVVLWYSASTMGMAGSPVDPDGQVLDRAWDTRRLGAAVVLFNVALVCAIAALVPPADASADDAADTSGEPADASAEPPAQDEPHEN